MSRSFPITQQQSNGNRKTEGDRTFKWMTIGGGWVGVYVCSKSREAI